MSQGTVEREAERETLLERCRTFMKRFPRAAYTSGEASNALLLVLFVLLARWLGVEAFGHLIAILAAAGILGKLNEFGFSPLLSRTVAREPDAAWGELRHALRRQAMMCLPLLVLLYGYMLLSSIPPSIYPAGMLIGASVCFRSLKTSLRGVSQGLERFGLEAVFLWTERVGLLAFAVLAVAVADRGLLALAVVFAGVRAVDFLVYLAFFRHRFGGRTGDGAPTATFAAALPFAVSVLMWSIYYQVDAAMLSVLATAHDTGIYGAVYRFVDVLHVLPRLIIVVAFPTMAVAWKESRRQFRRKVRRLQRALTAVSLPVLFLLIIWSEPALRLSFGDDYVEGTLALQLILLGSYFAFHSLFLLQALQTSEHEKLAAWGLAAAVLVNIALNLLLIPAHGYLGAAIATLVTEVTYAVVLIFMARRVEATQQLVAGGFELFVPAFLTLVLLTPGAWADPWLIGITLGGWMLLMRRMRPDRVVWRKP